MSRLRSAWAALFRRRALEGQMDEEMGFHLEMEVQKLERRGLDRETARSEALRRFGGASRGSRRSGRTSASLCEA
jgi:putative ABC transport system permease protein